MDTTAPPLISGPAEALRRLGTARDVHAWTWLIHELGGAIRRTVGRLSDDAASADDAAQEALLTIRDHAGSFRPRLDPDTDARRWVLRVAANCALELRRARGRARARDRRAGAEPMADPLDASSGLEREETARAVRDALADLAEPERTAIVLRVVEGLGYDQIASELRCREGTARSRVSRGLDRLRERLGRREAVASITALFVQPHVDGALPSTALALLESPRSAGAAMVPAAGMTLIGKLAVAASLAAALAVPATLLHGALTIEPAPPAIAAAVDPDPAVDIAAALDAEVTVDFADATLADLAAFVRERSRVPVALDAAAQGAVRFSMTGKHLRLRHALDIASMLTGSAWAVDDGRVVLGSAPSSTAAALLKCLDIDRRSAPLAEIISELAAQAGIAITIDPAFQGVEGVSLVATQVPLGALLAQLGEPLQAHAEAADRGLRFVPGAGAGADGMLPLGAVDGMMRDSLELRIDCDFKATDFADAVQFLQRVSGLNILVKPDLLVGREVEVTLLVENERYADLLPKLARIANARIGYANQAIVFQRGASVAGIEAPPLPRENR